MSNELCCVVNVGEDCPVFDGLYEFCQLSTGGSIGNNRTSYLSATVLTCASVLDKEELMVFLQSTLYLLATLVSCLLPKMY